jgi:hypothetical protein
MTASSLVLFFYVRYLLNQEVEEELYSTTARVTNAIDQKALLYSLPPVLEIDTVKVIRNKKLLDTLIYDPSQNEMEEFRELSSFHANAGVTYKITVRNLKVESKDILIAVVISYIFILLLVFILLFYLSKARNKRLWAPFFTNLEKMKEFSLSSTKPITLVDSPILEFSELKKELETITKKVATDYLNLKQYTENVSHELQTPLAVIKAKIETMINGNTLNKAQFDVLTSIQQDIYKLTQLNKRLSLLTKIENNQFEKIESISLSNIITELIQNFEEITTANIQHTIKTELNAKMDPYLAEVLCQNLLSNAIKYNTDGRIIKVIGEKNSMVISNQGSKELQHPSKLFTRFYKEATTNKATGLGLAIVKRICDLYNFKIQYSFEKGWHIFTITLPENNKLIS